MSAANRGADRVINDCYVTPPELCAAVVEKLIQEKLLLPNADYWVCEPSAGVGTFVEAIKDRINCRIVANEINPSFKKRLQKAGADKVVIGDWLEYEGRKFHAIIGNPPFIEAEYHVRHSVRRLQPTGFVAYVLRLNFFGGKKRAKFWKKFPPTWVFPITPRPGFLLEDLTPVLNKNGGKGSDATEYAVFVWTNTMLQTYERKHVVSQIGTHITWDKPRTPRAGAKKTSPKKKKKSKATKRG